VKRFSRPKPKDLEAIFATADAAMMSHALDIHINEKLRNGQGLTDAEQVFSGIRDMGRSLVNDGFVSLFHERFSPSSYHLMCDGIGEAGAPDLKQLLLEAWSIFTQGKSPISVEELRRIPVRHFNTAEKMRRFDEIGIEVKKSLEKQSQTRTVWSVEYAKRHRTAFTAIQ
jgi:hypothetical protein